MIVRSRLSASGLLFVLRGSIVPTIALHMLVVLAVSAAVAWWNRIAPQHLQELTPAPFTLPGLALSIFLGFRTNACCERWWEARRHWGQLVAEIRALMRDGRTVLPDDPALRRRLAHRAIAFAHALCGQLRGTGQSQLGAWLPAAEAARAASNRGAPDAIILAQSDEFRTLLRRAELSDIGYQILSGRLSAMTTIQTACERLRATPAPFTYTLQLHRTAWLYRLLLPFGLVSSLGLATPVATTILA